MYAGEEEEGKQHRGDEVCDVEEEEAQEASAGASAGASAPACCTVP